MMATNAELLNCPVCIDLMVGRIYQCVRGHSLCQQCLSDIPSPKQCPLCREKMTDVRNITVENLVEIEARRIEQLSLRMHPVEVQAAPATTKVNCRFRSEGCKYVLQKEDYEGHIKECIFRDMLCPFSTLNGNCFWIGKFSKLQGHFLTQHPDRILAVESEYEKPNFQMFTRIVCLIVLGKLNFILHSQWDAAMSVRLISVQNIGTKAYAQNWTYQIKFYQAEEPRRSVVFTDVCRSDSIDIGDIFQKKQCIVIPKSVFDVFGAGLRFKLVLQKNEALVANNRPKSGSNANSSGLIPP